MSTYSADIAWKFNSYFEHLVGTLLAIASS